MRYIKTQNPIKHFKSFQKNRFFRMFKTKKHIILQQNESRTYKNPFRKESKNYKRIIIFYILIVVLFTWLGLLLFLPNFKIKKIEFEGLHIIKQEEIENKIKEKFLQTGRFIPKDNFFLVRTKKISKFLNNEFSLHSIEINKKFPNTLQIKLVEKLSAIVYDNEKKYVLLGINGEVIKDIKPIDESEFILINIPQITSSTSSTSTKDIITTTSQNIESERIHIPNKKLLGDFSDYPILYDKRNKEIEIKTSILDKNFIEKIIEFYENIKKSRGVDILYMEMEHPLAGIKMVADKNLYILFQPNNNIQKQLNNL